MLVVILHGRMGRFITALCGGLAWPRIIGLAFWVMLGWYFRQERRLRYFLPVGILTFVGTFIRFSPYHQGLMWPLAIFLVWTSWPAREDRARRAVLAALALCIVVQAIWTVRIGRREIAEPYSPSAAAAPVLARYLDAGHRVDLAMTPGAFFSVALQPYFSRQPFANVPYRFWEFRDDPADTATYTADVDQRRVVVMVVEYQGRSQDEEARLVQLGYRQSYRFCGMNFYPRNFRVAESVCYAFYEPVVPSAREAAFVAGEPGNAKSQLTSQSYVR
jgi:hypothetical protein